MAKTKRCPKCGVTKPLRSFYTYRDKKGREHRSTYCRDCQRAAVALNRQKNPNYLQDWRDRNREHVREMGRIYTERWRNKQDRLRSLGKALQSGRSKSE